MSLNYNQVDINCLCYLYFVVNSFWSGLGTVRGSTGKLICCTMDIVCIWIRCVDLPENGFAVFWTLSIADSIFMQTL